MQVGRAAISTNNKVNGTIKVLGHEFDGFNKMPFDVDVADTLEGFVVRGDGGE